MSFGKALHDINLEDRAKAYETLGQPEKAAECYNNMIYKTNYITEKINKLTPPTRKYNGRSGTRVKRTD